MKRAAALAFLLAAFTSAVRANDSLPAGPADFFIEPDGLNAYLTVHLSGIPAAGHRVTNGAYLGWCIQFELPILAGASYQGRLLDPLATNLPPALATNPWPRLTYILNHPQGDVFDIQNAIWAALGQDVQAPFTASAQAMLDAANQFGAAFLPAPGQRCFVILDPMETTQRLALETPCLAPGNTNPPPAAPRLEALSLDAAGKFLGRLTGEAGRNYRIEGSADFRGWTFIQTVFNAAGAVTFCDTNAFAFGYRFYRAVVE